MSLGNCYTYPLLIDYILLIDKNKFKIPKISLSTVCIKMKKKNQTFVSNKKK